MAKYYISIDNYDEVEVENYYQSLKYINQLSLAENRIVIIRKDNNYKLAILKNSQGYRIEDHSPDIFPKWGFIDSLKIEGLQKVLTTFFTSNVKWREAYSWNEENPKYSWIKSFAFLSVFVIIVISKYDHTISKSFDIFLDPIIPNGFFAFLVIFFVIFLLSQIDHFINFTLITGRKKLRIVGLVFIVTLILWSYLSTI